MDAENIVTLPLSANVILLVLTVTLLVLFLWVAALWVYLLSDSRKEGGFFSSFFPFFIFTGSILSDRGKLYRKTLFKVLLAIVVVVLLIVGVLNYYLEDFGIFF